MKLTRAEKTTLEAIRTPVYVKSAIVIGALRKLAATGLCEVMDPLKWQVEAYGHKAPCMAVITPAGIEALEADADTIHRQEPAHAIA